LELKLHSDLKEKFETVTPVGARDKPNIVWVLSTSALDDVFMESTLL